jgi:hypothetical protein
VLFAFSTTHSHLQILACDFCFFEKATQAPTKDQPKGPKLVRNRGCNPETGLTKGNSKAQTGNQSSTARALERKNTEIPAG